MVAQPAGHREHRGDHRAGLPREVHAAVDPRRSHPQGLFERGDATFRHAAAHRAARDRSRGRRCRPAVSPASAIARSAASTRECDRLDHESPADLRHADAGEGDLVLELLGAPRHGAGAVDLGIVGGERALLGIAARLEQRDPHVFGGLEHHLHPQPDVDVVGRAVHDVGGETYPVVFLDGHDRDHVGRREARDPHLLVDREPGDHAPSRHLGRRPVGARGSTGRRDSAGGAALRTPSSAGTAACRRLRTSRRTRCSRRSPAAGVHWLRPRSLPRSTTAEPTPRRAERARRARLLITTGAVAYASAGGSP